MPETNKHGDTVTFLRNEPKSDPSNRKLIGQLAQLLAREAPVTVLLQAAEAREGGK